MAKPDDGTGFNNSALSPMNYALKQKRNARSPDQQDTQDGAAADGNGSKRDVSVEEAGGKQGTTLPMLTTRNGQQ